MDWNRGSDRIVDDGTADAVQGRVVWSPGKSLWIGSLTFVAIVFGPMTFSVSGFLLFVLSTVVTLCAGHSVGMHRRLIHNSFECARLLEYVFVYLGTLVGMAGPIGMLKQHDLRDWAQRHPSCHAYLKHGRSFWIDAWWQLHCDLQLDRPPRFELEERLRHDRYYAWLERYWMAQQLPWIAAFYAIGGWGWVVWGICARVSVSVTGHWLVGHFAHREGTMNWEVVGAGVQGHNVALAAWFSMGESWHNNHHAFPGSARIGLKANEADLGWQLIKLLERCGLAWSVQTPDTLPMRAALKPIEQESATQTASNLLAP